MIFPLLSQALDEVAGSVDVFFRDDDAGWANEELVALCDLFVDRAPLDLAVIPMAIEDQMATTLVAHPSRLGFHQHGYAHINHQVTGRKSELADGRTRAAIAHEIETGQIRLRRLFGSRLDPIFTPPWNRCGSAVVDVLVELDIRALSRESGVEPFSRGDLIELPVSVDWVKFSRLRDSTRPDPWQPIDWALATSVGNPPLGVMLHHEVMGSEDLVALDALIELLGEHPAVALNSMAALVSEREPVR